MSMCRISRKLTIMDGFSVHKVWRGHNKEANVKTVAEKLTYLQFLNEDLESKKYENGSVLEALTLMDNHTHEMNSILSQRLFSNHMRRHHSRYGAYFNREHNRCGKVAQDRPHTTLIENDHHQMETIFYIHANPIRAGVVKDARNYRWSTHRLYAFGIREPWMRNIRFPKWYMELGRNAEQRQRSYRQLFARYLNERGRFKQSFLKRHFFGSLLWMKQKEEALLEWKKAKAPS